MSKKFIIILRNDEKVSSLITKKAKRKVENITHYEDDNLKLIRETIEQNKFDEKIIEIINTLGWEKVENEKIYVSIHPGSGGDINNVVNNLLSYQEKVKEISDYDIKITYHGSQNEYLPKLPVNELEGFKDALIEFHKEILEKKIEEKEEMNLLRKKIEEEKTNKQQ